VPFGANPLEEHHELQLEEDHGIHRGTITARIAFGNEIAHEREIKDAVEAAVEMVCGDEVVERNVHQGEEVALFAAHHGAHSFAKSPKGVMLPGAASFFNTLRGVAKGQGKIGCAPRSQLFVQPTNARSFTCPSDGVPVEAGEHVGEEEV